MKINKYKLNKIVAVLFNLFIVLILYHLVENTRRIFGRAREENLGSRRIFLTVLAGHKKKTLSGPHVARGPLFANPCASR
jgi:hypothetical protein